jgi:TonB family protein
LRPLGLGLDEEAIRAYSQWRFEPSGGRAPSTIKVEAHFAAMVSPIDWRLSRATFDTPSGASRPHVISAEFPAPENKSVRASVAISFDVEDDGTPASFHVESSSDPRWEPEVITAAKQWRFQPAMKNDSPIVVRASFEFVHGPQR